MQSHSFTIAAPICWQSSKLFRVRIPISIILFATIVTSSVISNVVNCISLSQSINCVFFGSEHFSISLNVTVDKYTSYLPSLNISHNRLVSAIFSGTSSCIKWLITEVSKYTFNFRVQHHSLAFHISNAQNHFYFHLLYHYQSIASMYLNNIQKEKSKKYWLQTIKAENWPLTKWYILCFYCTLPNLHLTQSHPCAADKAQR